MKVFIACLLASSLILTAHAGTEGGKYANDVRHGPCVTGGGTPHDKQEYWTLVFSRAQPDQLDNPKRAKYGDDWAATMRAYPFLKTQLRKVFKELGEHMKYEGNKLKNQDINLPYTRVCIPNTRGIRAGLKRDDYNIHINPKGTKTDRTATLFYKAFIRNGRVWMPFGVGQSRH